MLAQLNFACRKRNTQGLVCPCQEKGGNREKSETCGETLQHQGAGSEDEPGVMLVLALTILRSPAKPTWLCWAGAQGREAERGDGSSLPQQLLPQVPVPEGSPQWQPLIPIKSQELSSSCHCTH